MSTAETVSARGRARAWTLADDVLLLVWDGPRSDQRERLRPVIAGRKASAPFSHLAEDTSAESTRHLLAFRDRSGAAMHARIEVQAADDRTIAEAAAASGRIEDADPTLLLGGLSDGARFKVVRFLVETAASLFKLNTDATYAGFCRQLFHDLFDRSTPLRPQCRLREHTILAEGTLPARLGTRVRAVVIAGGRVRSLPPAALALTPTQGDAARNDLALMLPKACAVKGAAIFVFAEGGLAGRVIEHDGEALPDAASWLVNAGASAERLVHPLIDAAARLAAEDPGGGALARELAMIAAGETDRGLKHGVDIVASGQDGIFVGGWISDRADLLNALEWERLGETKSIAFAEIDRFPHPAGSGAGTGTGTGTGAGHRPDSAAGFALFIPWGEHAVPLATLRLALRLKSGSRLPLWRGQPTPADGAVLGRVLGLLPAGSLGGGTAVPAFVTAALEPWVRAQQEQRAAEVTADELTSFGAPPERPRISVVMPLTDEPHLLRCAVASLAAASDRAAAAAAPVEIIFVADRARVRPGQVRLLRGLAAAFGISGHLAVIDRIAGPGSLLNGGAVVASAPTLVLLGAGVIAEQAGWLNRLAAACDAAGEPAIVAARILSEDHAIRDAGRALTFDGGAVPDLSCRFAGFPRDYPVLAQPRAVDAVSMAAVAMPRAVFDAAGGFDDRYLTAAYREGDFCFEIRRQGGRVIALPEPVLFDLAPAGEADLGPAALATATVLDRRLFAERWEASFAAEEDDERDADERRIGVAA